MSTPPPAGPTPSPEMTAAALPPLAGPSSPASSAGGSVKDEQQMRDSSPAPATGVKKDESDAEGEDAADLFGDDDDEDDADAKPDDDTKMAADGREGSAQASQNGGEEDEPMFSDNDSITSSVRERRAKLEYAEDGSDDGSVGRAPVDQEKFSAQLGAMTWEAHEGTDGKRWLLRLPKTVHHQHMPYSRDLYQEPDDPVLPELLEEDVQLTANEIERRKAEELMRQVGSTIRWRWTKDAEGRPVKQPNARIVKWSDGSLSLQLGKPTNMFSLVSHPDPSYPAAPQSYLVNHHWDAELMQTEGMYAGHMTLVPVGMEGEAHRILAKGVKERNREKSRMKMWDDDSMTASNVDIPGVKKARAKSVRGPREDNGGGSSRKKAVRSAAAAAGRGRRGSIYSDDSESELDDEEERRRRRRLSAGGGKAGASARDADDGGGYANDGFVVSDDDEEEDSRARSRSSKGKSKRRASPTLSSSEEEAEALESEEASSEEDARSRKRSKGGKEKRREREASIESEEMDSEDDDDGPGAGEIKKRRVVIADEDEEE